MNRMNDLRPCSRGATAAALRGLQEGEFPRGLQDQLELRETEATKPSCVAAAAILIRGCKDQN